MNLLNACLALVLTLGVFASVVTVLVEMIYQTIQQRAKDLRGMLGYVFDKAVPEKDLRALGLDVAKLRTEFTDTLRSDKVLDDLVAKHGFVLRFVARGISNASSMTIEDFLRRLPRSEVYRQFLKDLAPEAREKALKAMVEQFGRAEKAISEFFRVRAKLLSYLVGVCLALFVNVDAVRLFEHFAANPVATEQAIVRLQGLLDETRKEGGTPAIEAAEPAPQGKVEPPVADASQASVAASQASPAADPYPTGQDRADEIAAMLDRLRNSQSFGLPVGWAYYP